MPIQDFDFATGKVVSYEPRKAIVVDEDDLTRDTLQHTLKRRMFNVVAKARDSKGILELLKQNPVDVLFLQVQDAGLDALRQVREAYPELKVVIMGDALTREHVSEAVSLGVAGFLAKPFKPETVLGLVDRFK